MDQLESTAENGQKFSPLCSRHKQTPSGHILSFHRSLSNLLVLLTVVVAMCILAPSVQGAYLKKDVARLANSPIYYISTGSLFNSNRAPLVGGGGLNGGLSTANLFLATLRKVQQQKRQQQLAQSSLAHSNSLAQAFSALPPPGRPSTGSSSTLYRLPLQFISNAKPIEIISAKPSSIKKVILPASGLGTTISRKRLKIKKGGATSTVSKMIYLPLRYTSNGKPLKVLFNQTIKH